MSYNVVVGVAAGCEGGRAHSFSSQHRKPYGFRPTKLFVFGDSYADTGNIRKSIGGSWKEPYGITFPGKPAGRFSDGRVLTDYIGNITSLIFFFSLFSLRMKLHHFFSSALSFHFIHLFFFFWYKQISLTFFNHVPQ